MENLLKITVNFKRFIIIFNVLLINAAFKNKMILLKTFRKSHRPQTFERWGITVIWSSLQNKPLFKVMKEPSVSCQGAFGV